MQAGDVMPPRLLNLRLHFESYYLLACSQAGFRGSIALLLAYFLHLDAFGNIHWDSHDLLVGLALGSPVILLGAHS